MNIREALHKAGSSFQGGHLREAESICRKVLKAHRNHPDALHLLSVVALQQGNHQKAVELIEKALRRNSNNSSYYANLGEAYRALGQLDHAVSILGRSIEIDPDRAEAHCGLGNSLLAMGKIDDAIVSFERAVRISPNLVQAHYNKGNAYSEKGDLDEAIAAYRRAIAINPSFADANLNLGNALSVRGELVAAVAAYKAALKAAPHLVNAWYNVGNALRKLGRLEAARKVYERALELDASLAGAHLHLGTIAKLQGRHDAALASFDRAIDIEPESWLALSEKAHVHLIQGKTSDAIAGYRRAVEIEPRFAWGYMGLSGALAEVGRIDDAREASARAVRLRRTYEWPFLGRDPIGRVLVLKGIEATHFRIDPDDRMAAIGGMNNADHFFDSTRFHQASFYMDGYDPDAEAGILPACDVIFNAISDVDVVPKTQEVATLIAAGASVPFINRPETVAQSQRHRNYLSFRGLDGVVFPATVRVEERLGSVAEIAACLDDAGISLPVLVRRAGTHTGDSLEKADDLEQLQAYFEKYRQGPFYIVAFRDFRDARGGYVKLRMYFIDGVPYPSQLFVSDDWNVHVAHEIYRQMSANEWMLDSAKRFHADAERYLGTDAYRALASIPTRLPLDYFGIDFTQLDDGRIFIFEANATMRIPYLTTGELNAAPYRIPSIEAIVRALSGLLEKK